MPQSQSRIPTFNHVAMSIEPELLSPAGQRSLLDFYGDVFGWSEMPTMSEDGKQLVLRVHSNEQFVFLAAADRPMTCPSSDHFGMSVGTPEELHQIRDRALKYGERDPRVEVTDALVEDFKVLKLHSFYLRYLLPMRVELQCFEWAEGIGASSLPDDGGHANDADDGAARGT